MTAAAFERVVAGENHRVEKLRHPWFTAFAQNDNGHAALLIRTPIGPNEVFPDGRGFVIKTQRDSEHDYVSLISSERGAPPLFLRLVDFLLERTRAASSQGEALAVLVRSIDEFKRFAGRRNGRLSADQIRGLVAELLMMRRLFDAGCSPAAVVAAWKGPLAREGVGVHDFTFAGGRGIEVKSTHQPPLEVRVSSSQQLVPSDQRLDLVVLPLEELPSSSTSGVQFRDLAVETGELIRDAGPESFARWDGALHAVGLKLDDEYYNAWRFQPGVWLRFAVRDGFPFLAPTHLPQGLVKIAYSLELQHLRAFQESFEALIGEGTSSG